MWFVSWSITLETDNERFSFGLSTNLYALGKSNNKRVREHN
jgi:hypothetical protein